MSPAAKKKATPAAGSAKAAAAASPVPGKIKGAAKEVHEDILARKKPSLRLPIRSLANVRYAVQKGFFELKGGRSSARSPSARSRPSPRRCA